MNLEVIILAAGQGTRMKSGLPKVLHKVAGRSLLEHVVRAAQALNPIAIHVVVGHEAQRVQATMSAFSIQWVHQEHQHGTGHAVLQALPSVAQDSTVLILVGDVPLINTDNLQTLVAKACGGPALLTALVSDPFGLGRIVRNQQGKLLEVVEEKDATQSQRDIKEINTGVIAAPASDLRKYLPEVGNNNQQQEYYLPDILSLAVRDGRTIESCKCTSELEILGVNDRVQLNKIEREYQRRQAEGLMRSGVAIADSMRLDIRGELVCGEDVSIDVNVVMEGSVKLGNRVSIGPNCILIDVDIGDDVTVHAMSHLHEAVIADDCSVGPYARLRPGTRLAKGARIGNFVETKKSNIGVGSKVSHLSYIGDCNMGDGVNIGAGTITCNYDGVNKFTTTIGDNVFVGSNSTLIAPIEMEESSFIGAGSTVTRTVKKGELAVSRARQKNIQGWHRPTKTAGE